MEVTNKTEKPELNPTEGESSETSKVEPEKKENENTGADQDDSTKDPVDIDALQPEEGENEVEAISKKAKELEEENARLQSELKVPERYVGEEKAVKTDKRQSKKYDTYRAVGLTEAQATKLDAELKKALLEKVEISKKKNAEEYERQKQAMPNFDSKLNDIALRVPGGKNSVTYKLISSVPKYMDIYTELVGVIKKADTDSGVIESAENTDAKEKAAKAYLAKLSQERNSS